jgi:hypothetical protein
MKTQLRQSQQRVAGFRNDAAGASGQVFWLILSPVAVSTVKHANIPAHT